MQKVIVIRNGKKTRTNSTPTVNNRVMVGVESNKNTKTCKVLKECSSTATLSHAEKHSNERVQDSVECDINGNTAVPPPPSCHSKDEVHSEFNILDLGQHHWASISKNQLAKLNINDISQKCWDLKLYIAQQKQHTGFIPLSPLQFGHIRDCSKCQVDKQWLQKPIQLYQYVKSFKCSNFLGARVQVNFDINLDLVDELAASYWDWQLPLFLRYGFPMDFRGSHLDLRDRGVHQR